MGKALHERGTTLYLVCQSLGFEIGKYLSNNGIGASLSSEKSIWRSATAKLQLTDNQVNEIWRTPSAKLENWSTPAAWLFNKLNYTSLAYLTSIQERITRNTRGICRSFIKKFYLRFGKNEKRESHETKRKPLYRQLDDRADQGIKFYRFFLG